MDRLIGPTHLCSHIAISTCMHANVTVSIDVFCGCILDKTFENWVMLFLHGQLDIRP